MKNTQKSSRGKSFAPVYSSHSRALILGSYPSPQSFEGGFYYMHPQNRFWPLIAALAGRAVPVTIEEKKAIILQNNLALWDSLENCRIIGASDSSIEAPMPNKIGRLVREAGIEAIFCNGAASWKYYHSYCEEDAGLPATCMPSTSPANARYSLARLREEWAPLAAYMPDGPNH